MSLMVSSILLLSLLNCLNCTKFEYYWKEYNGEIPEDAVPGGLDRSNKPTYIAQVYIPNNGILPTRLYQGEKSVTTSRYGIHTSDKFIKILCSNNPEKLAWVPATAKTLQTDTSGKHKVVGGTEVGEILNIGRIAYQGEVIIGKVCSYNVGHAHFYFPYDNREMMIASYEVLIHE